MKMLNRFLTCSTMCWAFVLVCLCFSGAKAQTTKYQTITTTASTTAPGPSTQIDFDFAYATTPAETTAGVSLAMCYDTTKVVAKGSVVADAYSNLITVLEVVPDLLTGGAGQISGPSFSFEDIDSDPATNKCISVAFINQQTGSFPTSFTRLLTIHLVTRATFGVSDNGLTTVNMAITESAAGFTERLTPASIVLSNPNTNNPPVFTSPDTFRVAENTITTPVGTVTAPDPNTEDNVTYAFVGSSADTTDFSLDSTTGVLVFKTAPDFETPTDRLIAAPANAAMTTTIISSLYRRREEPLVGP